MLYESGNHGDIISWISLSLSSDTKRMSAVFSIPARLYQYSWYNMYFCSSVRWMLAASHVDCLSEHYYIRYKKFNIVFSLSQIVGFYTYCLIIQYSVSHKTSSYISLKRYVLNNTSKKLWLSSHQHFLTKRSRSHFRDQPLVSSCYTAGSLIVG